MTTPEGGQAIIGTALGSVGTNRHRDQQRGDLRATRPSTTWSPDLVDPVLDVHLKGPSSVTRAAWIKMREQNYGRGREHLVELGPTRQLRAHEGITGRPRWASSG